MTENFVVEFSQQQADQLVVIRILFLLLFEEMTIFSSLPLNSNLFLVQAHNKSAVKIVYCKDVLA